MSEQQGPRPPPGHEGFVLERPDNDTTIESMFLALMTKRGWNALPQQAISQMIGYSTEKKWSLIYQDRLTEWQGTRGREGRSDLELETVTH
jgi:cytokinesis protein